MTDYQCLQFEQSGRVARVTLHRPEAANAMNDVLARELAAVAARCDDTASIKAVILTGTGKFFSAGGDLKAMMDQPGSRALYVKGLADNLHRAIATFSRMDAPLIVAVNGIAAGAGFSLAVTGDLVLACEAAAFTMAYTRAGLSPDGSASFFLPRLIGLRKTQELMLTNRKLSAKEALDWGLVNSVVADEVLQDKAMDLAQAFAAGAKQSNAAIKKLLLASFGNGLEEQMEMEARCVAQCVGSSDGQEGLEAFLARRPARFA